MRDANATAETRPAAASRTGRALGFLDRIEALATAELAEVRAQHPHNVEELPALEWAATRIRARARRLRKVLES